MAKVYRQVVADKSITSSKSFNDFLYAWIVLHSEEENGERYIWKRTFVLSQLESELGITRKTIKHYMDSLIELGLLADMNDKLILTDLSIEGFGVEDDILQQLVDFKMRYMVSIYVFLKKGYWAAGGRQLIVSISHLKEYVGLSVNTRSNNKIIVGILETLRVSGLLNYDLRFDPSTQKSYYVIAGLEKTNYF